MGTENQSDLMTLNEIRDALLFKTSTAARRWTLKHKLTVIRNKPLCFPRSEFNRIIKGDISASNK